MNTAALRAELCRQFCADMHVGEVPAGLAFSLPVEDEIGDRIGAYLVRDRGAPYFADDGLFLAELEARGLPVLQGQRREFLDRTLRPAQAFVDEETLEIRTHAFEGEPTAADVVRFIAALSAARSVQFWTRETIRSTFVDDATQAIRARFAGRATVVADLAATPALAEFPADLLVRPLGAGSATAIFLVQTMDRMSEALMLWQEAARREHDRPRVLALVEDRTSLPMNSRKAQRVINRIDGVVIYRDDEDAAIERLDRIASLPNAA